MAGTWHDNEIITELTLWAQFRSTPGTRLKMHLFVNGGVTITDDFDCTTLTEPTFAGYAAGFVGGWTLPPVEGGEPALWTVVGDPVKFCRTDSGPTVTVFGYFFTREEDGECAGAEVAWPSGITFSNPCDCYNVTPSKTERDEVPGD
jgi:hypothetical protein